MAKQRNKFIKPEMQYIRVGVDYFKLLNKQDRYGILRTELKKWKKEEITLDHGRDVLKLIKKYDDFVMIPDNISCDSVSGDFYNLYAPLTHKPEVGEWYWTKVLLEHISESSWRSALNIYRFYTFTQNRHFQCWPLYQRTGKRVKARLLTGL